MFYLSQALLWMAGTTVVYRQFFFLNHLNFSLQSMGHINAMMTPLALVVALPLGWFVDRLHPMPRVPDRDDRQHPPALRRRTARKSLVRRLHHRRLHALGHLISRSRRPSSNYEKLLKSR